MKIFGSEAYAKIPDPKNKASTRSEHSILVGYNENLNTYRLLSLEQKWTVLNRASVKFNEANLTAYKLLYANLKPEQKAEQLETEERTPQRGKTETKTDKQTTPAPRRGKRNRKTPRQVTQTDVNSKLRKLDKTCPVPQAALGARRESANCNLMTNNNAAQSRQQNPNS